MEKFKLTQADCRTIITNQLKDFKIVVEKGRTLAYEAYGPLIDVIQYKGNKKFEPVTNFVFEGVGLPDGQMLTEEYRKNFYAAINLFFASLVQTHNYLVTIPAYSSFNDEDHSFMPESDLGPELSRDNMSDDAWDQVGHADDIDDKDLPF